MNSSTFSAAVVDKVLKDPRGAVFGCLDGAVLVGVTDDGEVGDGKWMWAAFEEGTCTDVVRLKDPAGVKGRFDLMLPGEPEPERLMDVRAVARAGTKLMPDEVLDALRSKRIVLSGDEAFFIRFTPELLRLLGVVFAP